MGGSSPRCSSRRRNPPAAEARTTSLTVPPSARLICFSSSSSTVRTESVRFAPIGSFRLVWGAAISSSRTHQLCESLRAPEGVPGAGGVGSEADGGLGGLQAGLARTHGSVPESQCGMGEASDAPLQGRGLGFRDDLDLGAGPRPDPAVRAAVDRPLGPLALGVQQDRRQVDGADPVDHAVVGLGDQGPAAVGEFEDCDLPERLGAIEPLRVILSGPLHQLVAAARRMQAGRKNVALDPEIPVLLPGGPVQAAGPGVGESLGIARQVGQPGDHVPADLLQWESPARVWLQDHDPTDVHVGALVDLLQLEEGRVEGGELLAHEPTAPALRRASPGAPPRRPGGGPCRRRRC